MYSTRFSDSASFKAIASVEPAGKVVSGSRGGARWLKGLSGGRCRPHVLDIFGRSRRAGDSTPYTKDLTVDANDSTQSTWYAGVWGEWGASAGLDGLYRTTDRGVTWTRITANLKAVGSCTISPLNPDEMYVTTEDQGLWYSGNQRAASPVFTALGGYPISGPRRPRPSVTSAPRSISLTVSMNRRRFLEQVALAATTLAGPLAPDRLLAAEGSLATGGKPALALDAARRKDWLDRWEKNILSDSRNRYCDKEMGEELGWLVSPFLNGYYYGYLATRDPKWIEALMDWMDSCLKRSVKEPDGFPGWPKGDGGGGESKAYSADSLLGEAMMLRPVVLMAGEILRSPALGAKWADKAQSYLKLAEEIFQKWDSRNCWREVNDGGLWIVPGYGIDGQTGKWSAGYNKRKTTGFSNPANKENFIACWMLALHDVTKKAVYRQRADQWFQLMKSRMRTRQDGKYFVWNYWDPAGPWDYKADGSPRHWVGVHPNGGYYAIDVEGMVAAFEHGLVFTRADIDRLVATNRDFMWNQQVAGARFQRIDGGLPDPRWQNSPGVLWTALVPYDTTLRQIFLANHNPASWGGLGTTPWFVSLAKS